MNRRVAATGSIVFLVMAGCASPPGVPDAYREAATQKPQQAVLQAPGIETTQGTVQGSAQQAPPGKAYHEKFVSFVFVGVERIEVQPGMFRSGAPVEFRVAGSLPYVNDRIESVETEVDPLTRTVKISVVVRRPAIRLPMVGQYDVKATFVPPEPGQYVLQADGIRQTVVVNGCETVVAGA